MYELKRENFQRYDRYGERKIELNREKIHLWDGGIYDNLGVEPIFKKVLKEEKELNFYIVSDAGASLKGFVPYRKDIFGRTRALKRLLDISMEQVDNLNSKFYNEYIVKENRGIYIRIGEKSRSKKIKNGLQERECKWAKNYPTNLKKPSEEDFDKLLQHGYESIIKMV